MVTDYIIINATIVSAYFIYRFLSIGKEVVYSVYELSMGSMIASGIIVLSLMTVQAYDKESSLLNMKEIEHVIKGLTLGFLIVGMGLVLGRLLISRYVFVFSYTLTIFSVTAVRMSYFHILSNNPFKKWFQKRILIYGVDSLGINLYRALVNSPKMRIQPVGFIDNTLDRVGQKVHESGFHTSNAIEILGQLEDIPQLIQALKIDAIYVSAQCFSSQALKCIFDQLRATAVQIVLIPDYQSLMSSRAQMHQIDDIPVIVNLTNPGQSYLWIKRLIDLLIGMCLALFVIVLIPLFGLLIKWDSKGPIFFCQKRVGKDRQAFTIYKFRTMHSQNNPYKIKPEDAKDERITTIGRWLRKTSLDELPQIFNVIKGDMSLVGPRPEMPFIVDTYQREHMERLSVKPGITGLWQLAGDRNKPIHKNMMYDRYYIQNMSFFLDIAILVNTCFYAFKGR